MTTAAAAAAAAKSLLSRPTLCNLIDGSPPGSPVHGTLQARILEWVTTRDGVLHRAAWHFNIRDMLIKTIMKYYLTTLNMVIVNNTRKCL